MKVGFEVAFISVYSLVLLALAQGLCRVGQINNDPLASRHFAAYRREMREVRPPAPPDWPHTEARRLYTGLALVAAAASTLLCAAEAVRHHTPAELGALAAAGGLGLASMARLARSLGAPGVPREKTTR